MFILYFVVVMVVAFDWHICRHPTSRLLNLGINNLWSIMDAEASIRLITNIINSRSDLSCFVFVNRLQPYFNTKNALNLQLFWGPVTWGTWPIFMRSKFRRNYTGLVLKKMVHQWRASGDWKQLRGCTKSRNWEKTDIGSFIRWPGSMLFVVGQALQTSFQLSTRHSKCALDRFFNNDDECQH